MSSLYLKPSNYLALVNRKKWPILLIFLLKCPLTLLNVVYKPMTLPSSHSYSSFWFNLRKIYYHLKHSMFMLSFTYLISRDHQFCPLLHPKIVPHGWYMVFMEKQSCEFPTSSHTILFIFQPHLILFCCSWFPNATTLFHVPHEHHIVPNHLSPNPSLMNVWFITARYFSLLYSLLYHQ